MASTTFVNGVTLTDASWFNDVNSITYNTTGSGNTVLATSPTLVTPVLGAATATSINKVAITAPATSATITVADGKTLTASNSITLAGTDSTTMTFPSTNATIARTDSAQTFTGVQSMTSPAITTSITTPSTTFALVNTTATTVNAFGAATTLNIGNSGGTNTILGATTFSQSLAAPATTISGAAKIYGSGWGVLSYTDNSLVIDNSSGVRMFANGTSSVFGGFTFYAGKSTGATSTIATFDSSGMNGALGQTTPAALAATTADLSGLTRIGTDGTGTNVGTLQLRGGSGSSGGALITAKRNAVDQWYLATASALGVDTSGDLIVYGNTGNNVKIYGQTALGITVGAAGAVTVANGLAVTGTLSSTKTLTAATGADTAKALYVEGYPSGLETALFYRDNTDDQTVIKVRHDRATGATSAKMLIFVEQSNTTVGSITSNGTATAYNTSSDRRLKNITGDLTKSGEFIDALQPRVGTWKADGSPFVGFVADEVQKVSPRSVVGEPDKVDADGNPVYQAMEYGSAEFIANIIAELKSVRTRLAALEAR